MSSLSQGEVESNTGSPSSWKQAISWIQDCTTNHPTCSQAQGGGQYKPTRLLKVSENKKSIRVCEKEDMPDDVTYTTLSHCRGTAVIGKLLTTNIDSLIRNIPLESLCKTFQDAVQITRRLVVDYIWIDCFCIIQDSPEDWYQESTAMEFVYGHSFCNIAATASADGRGGCFRTRDPKMIHRCIVNISISGKPYQWHLSDFDVWWGRFERSALNVRAWVLQERLLSPRVLHFDRDQLVWECNERTACERYPVGLGLTSLEIRL